MFSSVDSPCVPRFLSSIPEKTAFVKALKWVAKQSYSLSAKALGSPESIDVDYVISKLKLAESNFVDKLADVPIIYQNDDSGNFSHALDEFINNWEYNPDEEKYGLPGSVKELLDLDGIPEPNAATRNRVLESTLIGLIETIYENA